MVGENVLANHIGFVLLYSSFQKSACGAKGKNGNVPPDLVARDFYATVKSGYIVRGFV